MFAFECLVLSEHAISVGSDEPVHLRSLARVFAARTHKATVCQLMNVDMNIF